MNYRSLLGIFLHIQTWIIGVPIYVITDDVSRDASYIMVVALAFTFSTSQVALVIWPKIYTWAIAKFGKTNQPGTSRRTSISVLGNQGTRVSGLFPSSGGMSGHPVDSSHFISANSSSVEEVKRENMSLTKQNSELKEQLKRLEEEMKKQNSSVKQECAPISHEEFGDDDEVEV